MRTLSLFLLLALFLSACTGKGSGEAAGADSQQAEAEAPVMAYTLTPFSQSAAFPDASLESMTYNKGKFDFGVNGYELAVQTPDAAQKMCANSADGQHIHLIVDNQPYSAQYKASFDYDIPDGEHYILAFLSRSYHESIKTAQASIVKKVLVKDKGITETEEVSQPMLFYSRPKGTYVGPAETDKVMLDFYLANVQLGDQYRVKADINGEEHLIDTWQPYYIEGLQMGQNTITLTLVDSAGNPVQTPLNPVTRTFELKADQATN